MEREAEWRAENAGGALCKKARPAMRDGLYIRLYRRIAAAAYLPQKDRK